MRVRESEPVPELVHQGHETIAADLQATVRVRLVPSGALVVEIAVGGRAGLSGVIMRPKNLLSLQKVCGTECSMNVALPG